MIWAKIRFTLDALGMYAEAELGFPTEDIPQASMQAAQLCAGYKIAKGFNACIIQVAGHPSSNETGRHYKMPEQWDLVHNIIANLSRRSA